MFTRVTPKATTLLSAKKVVGSRGFAQLPQSEPLNVQTPQDVPLVAPELNTTTLPNGVKVVTVASKQPVSSVSLYVNAGSRKETAANAGASFFLRRFGFKSTKNLTALRLTRTVELTGGNYAVDVTRENLVYAAEVPADQTQEIVPLLSEVLRPNLKEYEVLEEQDNLNSDIEKFESNPREMAVELLHQVAYRNKTLGQSLYTPSYNVNNLSNEALAEFVNKNFTAENVTVVATGGVEHGPFVKLVEQYFANINKGSSQSTAAKYVGGEARYPGDFDSHIALGFEGVSASDKDAYALGALQYLLGSGSNYAPVPLIGQGVSGRLNRNVVEQHNFVQDVNTFNYNYSDSGVFGVLAVANKGNVASVVKAITKELKAATTEVSAEELNRTKALYKASVVFNTENRSALSAFVAQQASRGKTVTPSDFIKGVDAVTAKDVAAVAKRVLQSKPTLVVLGDVTDTPTLEEVQSSLKL